MATKVSCDRSLVSARTSVHTKAAMLGQTNVLKNEFVRMLRFGFFSNRSVLRLKRIYLACGTVYAPATTTTILCLSGLPDRSTIILDGSYTLLCLGY